MATFTKKKLSGSTNGNNILVNSTSSPGTLIHTSVTSTDDFDEIWIYAVVVSGVADRTFTLQFGGTSDTDKISVTIPVNTGLQLIVPGLLQQNSSEVRAFAESVGVIAVNGFVNRISV
jgi:hypothetical protein